MPKRIKYKDLIRKFTAYAENKVCMVASTGEVAFYDQEGMHRIVGLMDCEDKDGNYYVKENL